MRVAGGATSVRAEAWGETLHPVAGPMVEAHALYVEQLGLVQRLRELGRPLVVWDVGIGAGANALMLCRATEGMQGTVRLLSFDLTLEALAFAAREAVALEYPRAYEAHLEILIARNRVQFEHAGRAVDWSVHLGDFSDAVQAQAQARARACARSMARSAGASEGGGGRSGRGDEADAVKVEPGVDVAAEVTRRNLMVAKSTDLIAVGVHRLTSVATGSEVDTGRVVDRGGEVAGGADGRILDETWPAPDAILFDPYSPRRNPDLWSLEVFAAVRRCVAPDRPCLLATYSRSTVVRVALLLAGFYVGRGRAVAGKEETTVACDRAELLAEPLGSAWLARALRSSNAEPIRRGHYAGTALSEETRQRLMSHPQFLAR